MPWHWARNHGTCHPVRYQLDECLAEALRRYGDMSFGELRRLTHDDPAWAGTVRNEAIDYAKFVEPENPYREDLNELRDAAHTVI